MNLLYVFAIIWVASCFSCAKTDTAQKALSDSFGKPSSETDEFEAGRTLQNILFCDRMDFDQAISQAWPGQLYHRELIPYFREPTDGIYKYMLIETDEADIRNFEYIVSKEPIKRMDLYSETIHNDSLVIITPGMQEAYTYEVVAKLNGSFHKITELEKKLDISCKDARGSVDWYWRVTDKKSGTVISTEYVGQTVYLCGIEGTLGRYGTGQNQMSEEWVKAVKENIFKKNTR